MGRWGNSFYPGLFSPPFRARCQFAIKTGFCLEDWDGNPDPRKVGIVKKSKSWIHGIVVGV